LAGWHRTDARINGTDEILIEDPFNTPLPFAAASPTAAAYFFHYLSFSSTKQRLVQSPYAQTTCFICYSKDHML
jgi:hypothetical protein